MKDMRLEINFSKPPKAQRTEVLAQGLQSGTSVMPRAGGTRTVTFF